MSGRTTSGGIPERVKEIFAERAPGYEAFQLRHLYSALDGQPVDVDDRDLLGQLEEDYGLEASVVLRLASTYNECVELADVGRPRTGELLFARRSFKPRALNKAIDAVAATKHEKLNARRLMGQLRGRDLPAPQEAEDLRRRLHLSPEAFDVAVMHYRMAIALYRDDRSQRDFNRGARRRKQQYKTLFAAPAAIVRRIPVITNNHFDGPIQGDDIYGPLWCSEPLRSGAVGTLLYVLGVASHPSRYRRYGQVDDDGRVLLSQNRIYQAVASLEEINEPGGAGHECVKDWIGQLHRVELSGVNLGKEKASRSAPDMSIPSSPLTAVEKLVAADDGELTWVPWDDPRSPTRAAEYTVRFSVADWCLRRMGTTDDPDQGDRVFFNPRVWRCLDPAGRAAYMTVQGGVAYESTDRSRKAREVSWYAGDPWCLRFGWSELDVDVREKILLSALNSLYHVDARVVGYMRPWDGHNGAQKDFAVLLRGITRPRESIKQRLRRSDFILQLREYEDAGEDGLWPGRALGTWSGDPPARDL